MGGVERKGPMGGERVSNSIVYPVVMIVSTQESDVIAAQVGK